MPDSKSSWEDDNLFDPAEYDEDDQPISDLLVCGTCNSEFPCGPKAEPEKCPICGIEFDGEK